MSSYIGYRWLAERFNLEFNHFHTSMLDTKLKTVESSSGVTDYYTVQYDPGHNILSNIVFALKYEGISLSILKQVLSQIEISEINGFIQGMPSSKYAKQIGFFTEFLTGKELKGSPLGNYVDLIDPEAYVTPKGFKVPKWRITNNLPGTASFCPLVRRTPEVNEWLKVDFSSTIKDVLSDVPADVFARAINYLYFKETRSSNDIEKEKPTSQREQLFVNLLRKAGTNPENSLTEIGLVEYQNAVTDSRFNDIRFRQSQNYVGESSLYGDPVIHLIGAPPEHLNKIMEGIADFDKTSKDVNPIVRATSLSFGFVFIHPFEDGNGRVHRFLFNDILAKDGLLEKGVILPVSAVMFKNMADYDRALEQFSKPLMSAASYELDQEQKLTVLNPKVIADYYRYPDMTSQAEYMFNTVHQTINVEMIEEFKTLQSIDKLRSDMKYIVDMPNKQEELMIKLLHQGRGVLSKAKRSKFPMLTDGEVANFEVAYREAFDMNDSLSKAMRTELKDLEQAVEKNDIDYESNSPK